MYVGQHIHAIYQDTGSVRSAQGGVQDRTVFRSVDLFSVEQSFYTVAERRFFCQFEECIQNAVVHQVARIVEQKVLGRLLVRSCPFRIAPKSTQFDLRCHLLSKRLKIFPCFSLSRVNNFHFCSFYPLSRRN